MAPRVTMGRTRKLDSSSTMRAISAPRRRGAPSSNPAARPTVQAFIFSFCTSDDEMADGVRTLCFCASTLVVCIARTKGANAAKAIKKRILNSVIIDEPFMRRIDLRIRPSSPYALALTLSLALVLLYDFVMPDAMQRFASLVKVFQ